MRTTLSRAARSLPLFVSALAIAGLLADHPVYGGPQAAAAGSTVETEPPAIQTLRLKETVALAPLTPNAFGPGTGCDSDGDIFVQFASYNAAQMRVESDPGISEVMPESNRIATYGTSQLSTSDYPNSRLTSFSVLPKGRVFALIFTRRDPPTAGPRPGPEYYIVRFKDDGTTDSIVHIEAPPGAAHWFADLMAAFTDGGFLITGTSSASAERPSASSWRPFTGIYDPRGRFVREVTLPDDLVNEAAESGGSVQQGGRDAAAIPAPTSAVATKTQTPGADKAGPAAEPETHALSAQPPKSRGFFEASITTGGIVSAPDGNVWILRGGDPIRLYAVDSGGEVIKHFQFYSPVAGLKPFEFGFAGPEMVFFDFVHFATDPSPPSGRSKLVGLFNTVSEHFEGLYTLPETEKGLRIPACSDRHGGFLYLGGMPDNHLAVYDYRP